MRAHDAGMTYCLYMLVRIAFAYIAHVLASSVLHYPAINISPCYRFSPLL